MSVEKEYKFYIPIFNVRDVKLDLCKIFGMSRIYEIRQDYLILEDTREVKIRKRLDKVTEELDYIFTEKIGKGFVRKENERKITREEYEKLLEDTLKGVSKIRYKFYERIKTSNIIEVCIDVYADRDLNILEVEVETNKLPDKIKELVKRYSLYDVTEDTNYKNKNLAK